MAIVRDSLATSLAAVVAFVAFLIASAFPNFPSSKDLGPFVMFGLWYVGPVIAIVSIVLAPALIYLRRRGLLTLWIALGLYMVLPIALSIELLLGAPTSFLTGATVYLLSGLAAGIAYWAVAMLPSNSTIERDARRSTARPSL